MERCFRLHTLFPIMCVQVLDTFCRQQIVNVGVLLPHQGLGKLGYSMLRQRSLSADVLHSLRARVPLFSFLKVRSGIDETDSIGVCMLQIISRMRTEMLGRGARWNRVVGRLHTLSFARIGAR